MSAVRDRHRPPLFIWYWYDEASFGFIGLSTSPVLCTGLVAFLEFSISNNEFYLLSRFMGSDSVAVSVAERVWWLIHDL